ncbi:MAG: hypothetical protein HY869_17015 [Chloroflexi bacterium]|nr:hypothetical protein [Chloroflexota bacterium]
MKTDEFIAQWVQPFYLQILHGNYYGLSEDKKASFNDKVKSGLELINSDIVSQLLLSFGWREQITGSWFCGLKGWSQFADIIGTKLLESKVTYAGQGHSFALACFANEDSVKYLTQYLNFYLPKNDLVYDQAWVMPALMWVDEQNNTNHSNQYLVSGGLWDNYIADKKSEHWHLDNKKESFWKLMNYCRENYAKPAVG